MVIRDTLPPLAGFRGFAHRRGEVYEGLARIAVRRTGPVVAKPLAGGRVVATAHPLHLTYGFTDGRA